MGAAGSRPAPVGALALGGVGLAAVLFCLKQRFGSRDALQDGSAEAAKGPIWQESQGGAVASNAEASVDDDALFTDTKSPEDRAWALALVTAAGKGDIEEISRLLVDLPLKAGGPLEYLLSIDAPLPVSTWENMTGLGAAALNGHEEVLKKLLSVRANPDVQCLNATSWDGAFTLTQRDTPLCIAAKGGHRTCVEILLDAGANPNVQCDSEYFEGAVEWGDDDDGSEMMYYSAVDVANGARQFEIAELIKSRGGMEIQSKAPSKPRKMKITQGSRMGA